MRTKVKIKIDNRPWKKIERNLKRGSNRVVRTGFFDGTYPDGISVPQVAAWNEEGHLTGGGGYSPPRPFIRIGFIGRIEKSKLRKYLPYVNQIALGKITWVTLNKLIAEDMTELMKISILEWKSPPNSPMTIAKKGFNDPLIETGLMYDRVKSRIVRRGM